MLSKFLNILLLLCLTSCLEKQVVDEENKPNSSLGKRVDNNEKLYAPDSFNFDTSKLITIETFLYYQGDPLKDIVARIYDDKNNLLKQTKTDERGRVFTSLKIPRHTKYLLIKPAVVGLNVSKRLDLVSLSPPPLPKVEKIFLSLITFLFPSVEAGTVPDYTGEKTNIRYLATEVDTNGVPDNIIKNFESIPLEFLKRVDSSLPERKPVPTFHPQFITDSANTNIHLSEEADIWVTFLHEGAGYKNTMGFFTYSKDNPPTTPSEINELIIAFPNMSLTDSGGGLVPGDTVHLGRYPVGTSVGYFIMSNSWNASTKKNTDGLNVFYSILELNTTENSDFKHHNVLFWDEDFQKIVIGFEDLFRSGGGSDEDFNDAIFYVSTNPTTAVLTKNIAPIDTNEDQDSDGIGDQYDDYPQDPLRAFNNYYPLPNSRGTLLFEDLWPYQGDYDFNDLVLSYHFNYITNSKGEVKEIIADIKINATGASHSNGVALMLDIPAVNVAQVTGNLISENYINLNPNGTEAGMEDAVIILCDNVNNYMPKYSNVFNGMNLQPYQFEVIINLDTPVKIGDIGFPPYKPFLIKDMDRTMEIHQVDYTPTTKFRHHFLKRGDDRSEPEQGRFFRNKENMPWVLNIPYEMPHPKEKIPIFNAFKEFAPWAKSGGAFFSNWYEVRGSNIDMNKVVN